ncbi:MAG: HIT family protein, partial [Promethearchaeota archaeon]
FKVGVKISAALRRSGLRCDGVNLWLADGKVAGQEVLHVHLHIVPRFRGDGFRIQVGPEYGRSPTGSELATNAASISQALKSV